MANQPKRFKAILERGTEGLGWTIACLPFDPHKTWTKMQRLRVRGKVLSPKGPGVEFRTSLFPVPGESGHYLLLVNNRLQRAAGICVGSLAEFLLEPDLEPRPAELPAELASLLDEEPGLRDYYDGLSESMRREIGKWVMNVKSDASRMKRAEQMAERLLGAWRARTSCPQSSLWPFRRGRKREWVGRR
jgi:hypothetical protein